MTAAASSIAPLLDWARAGLEGPFPSHADAVADLRPRARGVGARSRRGYSRHPFDHHASEEDPGGFERRLSPLARRLASLLSREGWTLEAGSGPGHMTAWLRSRGIPIVAVDQSLESLRLLRRRTDAPAVAADVTALPFADEAFVGVIADGVVHHAERPAAALRELVRVLRPGGLLFLRVYRAEGRYPVLYRTLGGPLRFCVGSPPLDSLVWRFAFPVYRWAADRRYRRRRQEPGRHDEGVFFDYFLTPRATPARGSTLLATLRRLGMEFLDYEPYRNAHGVLARKRGVASA